MSTPRPSKADVEALAKVLEVHDWRWDTRNSVTGDGVRIACTGPKCEWFSDRNDDLDRDIWAEHRAHVAAVLSVLLAARDAEREREVAEAEVRGQMRHITAEVARGDQSLGEKEDLIADLRARLSHVGAERDSWRARAATNRDGWRQMLARAEAAERALADLRGEIKALADEWEVIGFGGVAVDLRALPRCSRRDDAAGAGGAE